MEKAKKHGLMALLMRENIIVEKGMEKGYLNGQTEVNMKEILLIICLMGKENILGVIKENI